MTHEEIIAVVENVYTQECVGVFSLDGRTFISTNIRRALEETFNIKIPIERFVTCIIGHQLISLLWRLLPEPAKEVDQGIMTRNEIYVKLVALFKRWGKETFTLDMHIGFNSEDKDSIELLGAIEGLFDIDMPDKDINKFFTGKSLIDLIEQLAINYAEPTLLTAEQLRAKIAEKIKQADENGMQNAREFARCIIDNILKEPKYKTSDRHLFNCSVNTAEYVKNVFTDLGYCVTITAHSEFLNTIQIDW